MTNKVVFLNISRIRIYRLVAFVYFQNAVLLYFRLGENMKTARSLLWQASPDRSCGRQRVRSLHLDKDALSGF
ncbi:MAG: hypothetical protein SAJ12_18455 [Jaaginema sp. PMC 1079.18]|nr:hypothetical protein [Jaaginema sp. PMC 1080.18]MEC4852968.1 hypothetical protein [Jaaginema sp. PMC 1079.18]MEC4868073.1 hypothetical protein [Jaaginema sp. PMC 1078.18]